MSWSCLSEAMGAFQRPFSASLAGLRGRSNATGVGSETLQNAGVMLNTCERETVVVCNLAIGEHGVDVSRGGGAAKGGSLLLSSTTWRSS
jgi:hypothetical protein